MNFSSTKHFLRMTLTGLALCPFIACGDDDKKPADTTDTVDTTPDTTPEDVTPDTTDTTPEDVTPDTDTTPEDVTPDTDTTPEDVTPDTTDTTPEDVTPDTTDTTDTTPEDVTPDTDTSSSCDRNGFTAAAQDAGTIFGVFTYLAQSTLGTPVDVFNLELLDFQGGADAAGTFAFEDKNYSDCGNCLTIWTACDEQLANCDKKFLVTGGTLQIDTFGESGGTFAGHIADAVLVEVTIDDNYVSTPVEGGQTWCLERYDFSTTVQ